MDQRPRRRPPRPHKRQDQPGPRPQGFRHAANPRQSTANARTNYERYINLAKDAVRRGETIEAENLYQHAEHYFRVMREQE